MILYLQKFFLYYIIFCKYFYPRSDQITGSRTIHQFRKYAHLESSQQLFLKVKKLIIYDEKQTNKQQFSVFLVILCSVGVLYICSFIFYIIPGTPSLGDFGYNFVWRFFEFLLISLLLAVIKIPQKSTDESLAKLATKHSSNTTSAEKETELPKTTSDLEMLNTQKN
jgi:hypothetical protein